MGRKQKRNFFHLFKGGKDDKGTTPLHGAPNTNLDTYDKRNGRFKSRRKYGRNGNAYVDLDTAHGCNSDIGYDHAHDIDVNNKQNPRSNEHRKLTRKERREINKAKRKRRFWK